MIHFFARQISCFLIMAFPVIILPLQSQIVMDSASTPEQLVNNILMGGNITATNIIYHGHPLACRSFTNSNVPIGMGRGIVFSTGNVLGIASPNGMPVLSTNLKEDGDTVAARKYGMKTFDAVSLEFDFVPGNDSIFLRYFFASEEYPNWIQWKGFSDYFTIQLSGPGINGRVNMANVPGEKKGVSSYTVNDQFHPRMYIDNNPLKAPGRPAFANLPQMVRLLSSNFGFDGFTKVFTAKAPVIPGQTYHLRILLLDIFFPNVDSGLFLEAGSFTSQDSLTRQQLAANATPLALRQPRMPWDMDDSVQTDPTKPVVVFNCMINFDSDSRIILPAEETELEEVLNYSRMDSSWHIYLAGHTDNAGDDAYNQRLSRDRAEVIRTFLTDRDVPADHIHYSWKGENRPIADNTADEGRAENRRVQVYVVKKPAAKADTD